MSKVLVDKAFLDEIHNLLYEYNHHSGTPEHLHPKTIILFLRLQEYRSKGDLCPKCFPKPKEAQDAVPSERKPGASQKGGNVESKADVQQSGSSKESTTITPGNQTRNDSEKEVSKWDQLLCPRWHKQWLKEEWEQWALSYHPVSPRGGFLGKLYRDHLAEATREKKLANPMITTSFSKDYICPRCKMFGFPSAMASDNYCTACANHFRFGHLDPKAVVEIARKERKEVNRTATVIAVSHPYGHIWNCSYGGHATAGTGFTLNDAPTRKMCLLCLELCLGWRKPLDSGPAARTDQSHSTKHTDPADKAEPTEGKPAAWPQVELEFPRGTTYRELWGKLQEEAFFLPQPWGVSPQGPQEPEEPGHGCEH